MIKTLCIVRLSALGDVLMLVPLIRTLQKSFPEARITWVISPPAYDLVEGMDGVEFIVINKPESLKDYWRFKKKLAKRQFDVLLACQASLRANLLYPLIRAKRKIGYDAVRAKDGHGWLVHETISPGKDHTLDGFLKFADCLGVKEKSIRWDLPIQKEHYDWAEAQLPKNKKILIINPAASKPERSWLVERYIAVIQKIQAMGDVCVIVTGGPGAYDRDLAKQIAKSADVINLVGQTRPKQLLALISKANAMLCPDTGPSHMAAAVGTPVVALHAVTSAAVSGPYIFQHLAIDCYPQAVELILGTTMEKNTWGRHAHGAETMKLIDVDAVVAKLQSVLNPELPATL